MKRNKDCSKCYVKIEKFRVGKLVAILGLMLLGATGFYAFVIVSNIGSTPNYIEFLVYINSFAVIATSFVLLFPFNEEGNIKEEWNRRFKVMKQVPVEQFQGER